MSYGMDMCSKIRTEASITIGDYIFDIDLVNHRGWSGPIKYDVNELEIIKRRVIKLTNDEYFEVPNIDINSYNINKIKEGYWDNYMEMYGSETHHAKNICIDLHLYKEAIAKFEKLKVFI